MAVASPLVDYGVLIGRFQPVHRGHLHLVREALNRSGKLLLLAGSSNRPRLERNPWAYEERKEMISLAIHDELGANALDRVEIAPLPDRLYDHPAWLQEVQHVLLRYTGDAIAPSTGIFGHHRDATSFYLNDFPSWTNMVAAEAGAGGIEATHIRKAFFRIADEPDIQASLKELAPPSVVDWLWKFRGQAGFETLMTDIQANADYKSAWGLGPHTAADAVVHCSGHILVGEVGRAPMKGLLALPGGFLDKGETYYACAVRELGEEARFSLVSVGRGVSQATAARETADILRRAYKGRDVFDEPSRSERAYITSVAHLFDLGSGHLPPLAGTADPDGGMINPRWAPLTSLRAREMRDDHAFIVPRMLKMLDRGMVH